MDWLFLQSNHKNTETKGEHEFIVCAHEGEFFVREQYDEIVAYYIINKAGIEVSTISEQENSIAAIWGFAHTSDFPHFQKDIQQNFKVLSKKEVDHLDGFTEECF